MGRKEIIIIAIQCIQNTLYSSHFNNTICHLGARWAARNASSKAPCVSFFNNRTADLWQYIIRVLFEASIASVPCHTTIVTQKSTCWSTTYAIPQMVLSLLPELHKKQMIHNEAQKRVYKGYF